MCSSARRCPAASRSAAMESVTLASGALAAVMPTAGIRPVSRSRSTCRLYPLNSTDLLLRPWRMSASSTLIRRSVATPRRRTGARRPGRRPGRGPGGPRRPPRPRSAPRHSRRRRPRPDRGSPSTRASAASRHGAVVPVRIQGGLQAGGGQGRHSRLRGHDGHPRGLPPPLRTRDHAQGPAQGVSHQVDRVLPPGPPPTTGRNPAPPAAPAGRTPLVVLASSTVRSTSAQVQVLPDQPLAERHQRALRKRRVTGIQAIQRQLPAPVHHRRLDHLVIGHSGIRLQDRGQRQPRRRHRRMPLRAVHVRRCQPGLELLVEQLMPVLAQEHKQPRPPAPP